LVRVFVTTGSVVVVDVTATPLYTVDVGVGFATVVDTSGAFVVTVMVLVVVSAATVVVVGSGVTVVVSGPSPANPSPLLGSLLARKRPFQSGARFSLT